jgi:hypothetical protein
MSKFNHNEECLFCTIGKKEEKVFKKFDKIIDDANESGNKKLSIVAENFYNTFSKKELATLLISQVAADSVIPVERFIQMMQPTVIEA